MNNISYSVCAKPGYSYISTLSGRARYPAFFSISVLALQRLALAATPKRQIIVHTL